MAHYTKYSVQPEDIPRRRRQRRDGAVRKKRKWLWLKLTAVLVLLLAIAGLGVAAGAIYALSRNLPSLEELRRRPNATNTVIYASDGSMIAQLHGAENRVLVPSAKIPDVMKEATVAVEDERFYEHHGVDFQAVVRAMVLNVRAGATVQGGSTITEQFVKNAYVGAERTYTRKLREAVLAWQLEDRWSKDKILTEYLNTVFYGANAYGVEAAARTYFHKHVWQVNLKQAALLAALPKAPSQFNPVVDPKGAKERRNLVLQLMADQGYITQEKADRTAKATLGVYKKPPATTRTSADYFVDYVTRQLVKKYGARQTFEGGLRVYTSINMDWQKAAIDAIQSTIGDLDMGGWKPAGAMVAVDPKTGYIRAMVGGTDFKKKKFNLASQSTRQAGSAFKPFTLTAAVEMGMDPKATYYVAHTPTIIPMGAYAAPWVVNGDGNGRMTVAQATWMSENTVYAQLCVDTGPDKVADVARRMGITSPLDPVPSITLGTQEVNPLEMADAYATLASNGVHHKPQAIVKVVLSNGRTDWKPKTKGDRAISDGVAYEVTKTLEGVASGGTGSGTGAYFPYPRAGKTGTTDDGADLWYVGYTPQLSVAVWMGDPDQLRPMPNAYGATYCVPMWGKFMAAALKNAKHPSFPPPKKYAVFTPWKGKYSTMSPSPSDSGSPSPTETKTIKPTSTPTKTTAPPTPTSTPTKTTSPTPTPTGSAPAAAAPATARAVTLVAARATATTDDLAESRAAGVAAAVPDGATTGAGDTGLVGRFAGWLAGLFGL